MIARFDELSLQPGDRVMIVTENEFVAVGVFIASILDGIVPVMLAPYSPPSRLVSMAASVCAELIFVDGMQPWMADIPSEVAAPGEGRANRVHWTRGIALTSLVWKLGSPAWTVC